MVLPRLFIVAFLLLVAWLLQAQTSGFQLKQFALVARGTVDIAHCGDSRLFAVNQVGWVRIIDSTGKVSPQFFLNIEPLVLVGGEQGLLGLAFHPNFKQTGWIFVNYTKKDGNSRVSRFSLRPNNPNQIDPLSELPILEVAQPFPNHNGGCLKFGPDGQLYIGFGDGGAGGDPYGNGQNTNTFLGKILRINVDSSTAAQPYAIPADNPFVGKSGYAPEIWSLGWRNPWRFSFDRLLGDMWIGDVGQDGQEEIDVEAPGNGGLNYGWRCMEGTSNLNFPNCLPPGEFVKPAFTYGHTDEPCLSVTGGFVYRGTQSPGLYGRYLFTDYCTGHWWMLNRIANGTYASTDLADLNDSDYSSLGEDSKGELYVAGMSSGKIYKISYSEPVATAMPSDVTDCRLSPNPTQDVFELVLALRTTEKVAVALCDAQQRVFSAQNQHGSNIRMQFDLRSLPAGTYYLKVQTLGGHFVKEVVKL